MLFDTSSPNRRRAVQVTFAFLALLMGGGLVLFGIGGASTSGGGIFDALSNSNTTSVAKQAEKDAKSAQKVLDKNPKDVAASAKLARAYFVVAQQEAFDSTGALTKDGQPLIDAADSAWSKYLALGPAKPDAGLSIQYSTLYASNGVAKYDKAARAVEAALVTRTPTSALYYYLAVYSLAAGDTQKFNEARSRAIALAPNAERKKAVTKQIDDIKKQIDDARAQQAKQAGTTAGSTPLKTLPSLGG